jgi:hypothetical protein
MVIYTQHKIQKVHYERILKKIKYLSTQFPTIFILTITEKKG